MIKFTKLTATLSISAIILTGCGSEEAKTASNATGTTAKQMLSPSIMLTAKPEQSVTVGVARKAVTPGKEVTITGQVGGVLAPFVANRASMVIADHTVMKACNTTCNSCKTPWDFCCEPPEVHRKNTLTVQFVDHNGMVIRQGLENHQGINPNSIVTISGKYAPESTDELVIINADKIFLEK